MKLFVSHSSKDKGFVRKLCADLRRSGHIIFFDEWSIKAGECIPTKISDGLETSDRLILVLTESAVASNWVGEEWKAAYWEQVSERSLKVIPILVEACKIPILLRAKKYVDFGKSYENGLNDLLASLADDEEARPVVLAKVPSDIDDIYPRLTPAAAQLADCMSDISECYYHAGWMEDLEYSLWDAVEHGSYRWVRGTITDAQIELLKTLSEACKGWISWDHTRGGKRWVPLDHWRSHIFTRGKGAYLDRVFHDASAESQRRLIYGFVDDPWRSSWKREALFFDRIVLGHFTMELDSDHWAYQSNKLYGERHIKAKTREFIDLVKKGVMLPSSPFTTWARTAEEEAVQAAADKFDFESFEGKALTTRLKSLVFMREHGAEAYPVYEAFRGFSSGLNHSREAVLRIIFGRIPTPAEHVSWDEIVGYREDPESQRRFAALRMWINRAVALRTPAAEVVDELEHLTAEFEAHLRRHGMSYRLEPLETIVAKSPEAIAELTGRHGRVDSGVGLQMIRSYSSVFAAAEATAPGRELAYIIASQHRFNGG